VAENSGQDLRPLSPVDLMTPQEAGAELARLTAEHHKQAPVTDTPGNAIEALALKQAIINDAESRGLALSGNSAVTKELAKLDAQIASGSPVDFAMAGVVPEGHIDATEGGALLRDQVAAVPDLRDAGHTDEEIRFLLGDGKVSGREYDAARRLQSQRMANVDWRTKLLAGDHDTVLEFNRLSMILASEVDEALA
jgi:hypothetical protein